MDMFLFDVMLNAPLAVETTKGGITKQEVQAAFNNIVKRNPQVLSGIEVSSVSYTRSTGKSNINFTITYQSDEAMNNWAGKIMESIYSEIGRLATKHGGFGKTPVPSANELDNNFNLGKDKDKVVFVWHPSGDRDGAVLPGPKTKPIDQFEAIFYLKQPKIKKAPQRENF